MIMSQRGELNSQPVDKMLEVITENKETYQKQIVDHTTPTQTQHKPLSTLTAPY